jgi:hypothetical protein
MSDYSVTMPFGTVSARGGEGQFTTIEGQLSGSAVSVAPDSPTNTLTVNGNPVTDNFELGQPDWFTDSGASYFIQDGRQNVLLLVGANLNNSFVEFIVDQDRTVPLFGENQNLIDLMSIAGSELNASQITTNAEATILYGDSESSWVGWVFDPRDIARTEVDERGETTIYVTPGQDSLDFTDGDSTITFQEGSNGMVVDPLGEASGSSQSYNFVFQ